MTVLQTYKQVWRGVHDWSTYISQMHFYYLPYLTGLHIRLFKIQTTLLVLSESRYSYKNIFLVFR